MNTSSQQLEQILSGPWAWGWLDGAWCLRIGARWLCLAPLHLRRLAVLLAALGLLFVADGEEDATVSRPRVEEVDHAAS